MNAELKLVEPVPTQEEAPPARIVLLQPNDLAGWIAVEPFLKRALEHTTEWALDDVCRMSVEGSVGLILCVDADSKPFGALCIEFINYPKKRVMQIHLFGADNHSEDLWMNWVWPAVQDVARQHGAASIMGTGRDGWVRKLHAAKRYVWEVAL
jgi:hypothetical protein